jgi:putative ABC transport system substrate-binding protein
MRRRDLIMLLGGAAAAWPIAARAQQRPALPVVAFVSGGAANALSVARVAAFRKGLGEAGYTEGSNVTVEYHWIEGHYERLPELMGDLVRRRVDVIATPGTDPDSLAAKAATSTIPIVFGVAEDPVTLGLVNSLARPGGNATGINFFNHEIDAKRLGMMHQLLPGARRLAVLINPANVRVAAVTPKAVTEAARTLGLELAIFNASTPSEIDAAFEKMSGQRFDALFIAGDAFFSSRLVQLATLTGRERMPASFAGREGVEAGLLMSYGTNILDVFRQVGVYSGSILKGAKPADLPVLQATKFELILNAQTARALGIEIPPMVLALADDVIE